MKDTTDKREPSHNETIMRAFAQQFDPPLKYVRTDKVNGVRYPDAYVCSYWDKAKAIGITAVVYEGQIHAYIESAGAGVEVASGAGKVIAKAMGLIHGRQPK